MTRQLHSAFSELELRKKNRDYLIPGLLGFLINGIQTVEVSSRNGYVYVRLRDNMNEVVQAYNNAVSPVYNLPVLLFRDDVDKTRYRIQGRDLGRYGDWGSYSAYLPRHGSQHSFVLDGSGGGDIAWIYGNQFVPLLGMPSGSSGGMGIAIGEYNHFYNGSWQSAGNTGTVSLAGYKPTDNTARMVLVYMDEFGNPGVRASSNYFTGSITGSSAVMPYMPALQANEFPVCGVRLVSGTSIVTWANIYDVRDHYGGQVSNFYAKNDEAYIMVTGSANLSNERVLKAGQNITISDGGAGGNLTISTPSNINGSGSSQAIAHFTDADTLSAWPKNQSIYLNNISGTATSIFLGINKRVTSLYTAGRIGSSGTSGGYFSINNGENYSIFTDPTDEVKVYVTGTSMWIKVASGTSSFEVSMLFTGL